MTRVSFLHGFPPLCTHEKHIPPPQPLVPTLLLGELGAILLRAQTSPPQRLVVAPLPIHSQHDAAPEALQLKLVLRLPKQLSVKFHKQRELLLLEVACHPNFEFKMRAQG